MGPFFWAVTVLFYFYFILFYFFWAMGRGGVGNVPLITPWAAAGAGAQTARLPGGAAPWGRPRRHVPVLSGIRNQPVFLV